MLRSHSSPSYKFNNPDNQVGPKEWNARDKSTNARICIRSSNFYDESSNQNSYYPKHSSSMYPTERSENLYSSYYPKHSSTMYPTQKYHCKSCDHQETQRSSVPLHQSNFEGSSLATFSSGSRYKNQESPVMSRNAIVLKSRSPTPTRKVRRKGFQPNDTNYDQLNRNTERKNFLHSQNIQKRSVSASRSNTSHQVVTGNRNTNSYLVYAQHQAKNISNQQETKYLKVIEQGVYVIKTHLTF